MKWAKEDEFDISERTVKRQIDKQTSYKRSVIKRKLLPSPQKRLLQEQRKERMKQLSEAGVKKQFVIKNRKRVQVKGPAAPPLPPTAKKKKHSLDTEDDKNSNEEKDNEDDKSSNEEKDNEHEDDPAGRHSL